MDNEFGMQATLRRGCGSEEIYTSLAARARELADACADPADRLAPLCDALWSELAPRGLSWIGFYLVAPPSEAEARTADPGVATEMILAARRDKPACSPIGLQGVCGQGFLEERIRLVEDVGLLGAGYIACAPRDPNIRVQLASTLFKAGEVLQASAETSIGLGINPRHAHWLAIGILRTLRTGAAQVSEQLRNMFFHLLRATALGADIQIAALRASFGHLVGKAAMVTAQGAVDFVEDTKRTAMAARTFPAAGIATQDRRIAAPVDEHQALLAAADPLAHRFEQRG
jgi:putative methionine-R-sulfoxide reductase with GAF domain